MKEKFGKFLLWIIFVYLVIKSCFGFYKIAWGTGSWWGEYSFKWGLFFLIYVVACIGVVFFAVILLWRQDKFEILFYKMIAFD